MTGELYGNDMHFGRGSVFVNVSKPGITRGSTLTISSIAVPGTNRNAGDENAKLQDLGGFVAKADTLPG